MDKERLVKLVEAEAKLEVARNMVREVRDLGVLEGVDYNLQGAEEHLKEAENYTLHRIDQIKIPF